MRRTAVVAALAIAFLPAGALARKQDEHDGLMVVLTPTAKGIAAAHPHVNVLVSFEHAADGSPAAPATFKARLGRTDITADFTPIVENGVTVGMRTALPAELLRLGGSRRNRLRLSVDADVVSRGTGKNDRRARDKDRVRFRAEERPNQPPIALAFTGSRILLPSRPVSFDGSESHDPDDDVISHRWDFGDGTTSDEVAATHTFADTGADVGVRLTVSDGQNETTTTALLKTCTAPDGAVPGFLEVTAEAALELGPVPPGTTATRTVTVRNTDEPGTTVATCVGVASRSGAFSIEPESFVLAGGESRDVALTFAPQGEGHADATLTVVGSARERPIVTFLAHGYGGSGAQPSGPTLAPAPFFYSGVVPDLFGVGISRVSPDGTETLVDNAVNTCDVPQFGIGTGDLCVENRDCAANGGTCATAGTCLGGLDAGNACSVPQDCAAGLCSASALFEPGQMCGDGEGGLYLLQEDTYTDPALPFANELSGSVLALQIGADGSTTSRRMLGRLVSESTQMACDGFAPDGGGRVYVAEYQEKERPQCFRTEQERLVTLRKSNGARQVLMDRIDAAAGIRECGDGDIDPVLHLETSADGASTFASFESSGLWRIRPGKGIQFLSADDNFLNDELFRLHPDGDLLYTTTTNGPTSSVINLYKIGAEQVTDGPVPLDALTPCAVYQVPNNGYLSTAGGEELPGSAAVIGFDAAPVSSASHDATVLVNFASRTSKLHPMHLSTDLAVQGTVAFSSPAGSKTCQVLGLTNLRILEQLTF